ncbi:MAG: urate hydroxylase PuuD [candidate division Zixibacteria bacterium]|nr:urate hydroxylase PuuD [candidate division Zixibacteria bacterium]
MQNLLVVGILDALFRWLHVLFGVIWIGHLYFFNFVNAGFAATMDGDTKKKVVPELMPRALYWFRWGAAWTYLFGILLLVLLFYHQKAALSDITTSFGAPAIIMILLTMVAAPFIYDALQKSGIGKNPRVFGAVTFVLVALITLLLVYWAKFSYRGFNIHIGAMFGTIMAFNVWFRIWPSQKKIITAIKEGTPPDPGLVALAGGRSRHNTYMSVPLLWTMINFHTTAFSGGNLRLTTETAWIALLVIILIGWHMVWQIYKKAAKVKGF